MDTQNLKPSDARAEAGVIGSMIAHPKAADIAVESLQAADFFNPRFRTLFTVMADMHARQMPMDEIVLQGELERRNLGNTFDQAEIGRLMVEVPSGVHVEEYCKIVSDKAARRGLWDIAESIREGINGAGDTDEILGKAQTDLDNLSTHRLRVDDDPQDLHALAEPIAHEALTQPPQEFWGLRCGLGDGLVDDLTGGLAECKYWIIAARTNVGKSTFVTALARGVRRIQPESGVPLIISTEMDPRCIARQSLAGAAGVSVKGLLKRDLHPGQRDAVWRVIQDRELAGVAVKYMPGATIAQLRAVAKRHKNALGLPLLIVDLASKIKAPGGDERTQLNAITTALSQFKGELNTCVIACVQLSRAVFMDADKRPGLQHLKGSGNWEEDADKVLFLHRPAYFGDGGDKRTEVIQAKDRDFGNLASCHIQYDNSTGRFFDPAGK
jgi:replicative DNA helicase